MDAFCFPGTSLAAMVTGLGAHTERAMTATVCITRPFLQRPGASASLAQSEPWNPFARGTRACRLAVQRPMGPNSYVFFFFFLLVCSLPLMPSVAFFLVRIIKAVVFNSSLTLQSVCADTPPSHKRTTKKAKH